MARHIKECKMKQYVEINILLNFENFYIIISYKLITRHNTKK